MTQGRLIEDKFWAQCWECGVWQEVAAEPKKADLYFEYWQACFCCCRREQTAWFTIEKVEDDVH
jgi:hypothetical protein